MTTRFVLSTTSPARSRTRARTGINRNPRGGVLSRIGHIAVSIYGRCRPANERITEHAINGNVTITANYKPIEVEEDTYTVTFVDGLTGETIEVRAGLVELPGESCGFCPRWRRYRRC